MSVVGVMEWSRKKIKIAEMLFEMKEIKDG